ncbi:MAG: DNA-3-methyladenine glycosylase 2 family protein [Candidatus Paraimprobicoccus trichonymphae]|uniref:DNA-(apurinic or apyrimidinic site) lyase n=1 Tax=Candidatus Paraimprobicoccus trichonymphae TaxID=3033793 RepID=A0AA48I014_9FIRM|nr:MAG: DNA-3-methyladenine glycosylase 2 family protein [Candidatus Paraimprobicoccus trichonymphae]
MNFLELQNKILITEIKNDINLENTLECGQCFRWKKINNKYHGIANNENITVYKKNKDLIIENSNINNVKNFWVNYFDLNLDYTKIKKYLSNTNTYLLQAYESCPDIHILNQEPWETLCSFIISQNNNIPRIKKIISKLCENFGYKLSNNNFSFPDYKIMSQLKKKDLEIIKSGFRTRYILNTAEKISTGEINLEEIKNMEINQARKKLVTLNGVGPKISECVLLYSYHKLEAFPMDIWMKKVVDKLIANKDIKIFGKYAGIAQQYLYYYIRKNKHILEL